MRFPSSILAGIALATVLGSPHAVHAADADAPSRFEVWLQGAYAVAPAVVDPLGALLFRFRQPLPARFALGVQAGPGLACLGPCTVSPAWVLQIPVSVDLAYVIGPPDRAGLEVAAGYGLAPSFPLGEGETRFAHGPLIAVRARTARNGGLALAAGIGAQLVFVAPSTPFERTVAVVVQPMVGVTF